MINFFIQKIRLILWLILIFFICFLLFRGLAINGRVNYSYDFSKQDNFNYFIGKLTPKERLKIIENIQVVVGEPVYFFLRTLRRFDKAKIILQYQNPDDLPLIELGLLKNGIIWNYDLKPIVNKTLNQLIAVWHIVYGNDGEILLQKEKKYQTVDEFLKNLPPIDEIASYNYDLKYNYKLYDYKSKNQENKIIQPLRGSYQFYTYIKNEKLDFKFVFSDLNINKNSDPIKLNLYCQNKLIDSKELDDIGGLDEEGKKIDRGSLSFNIENLSEGAYKIELVANDDIITEQIVFKQSKLSFMNHLWLAEKAKEITLKTDSNVVSAQTINPDSLQKIKIGDDNLILDKTYQQFDIVNHKKNVLINFNKGDVMLSGNGVFSFNEDNFIEPIIRKVDDSLDINVNEINYVIAKYNMPKEENEWQIAEVEFDLFNVYREGPIHQLGSTNKMSFLISIPSLNIKNNDNKKIIIGKIRIELFGKSLLEKIKKIFYDEK